MAEIIACPSCAKQLSVPETLLGKAVKCPGCANVFTVHPQQVAPTDPFGGLVEEPRRPPREEYEPPRRGRRHDYEEDEDYPRSRDTGSRVFGDEKTGWQTVRTGMSLCIMGMWLITGGLFIYLLVILIFFVGASAAGASRSGNGMAATGLGIALFGCVTFLLWIGGSILHLIGQGFGMGAPDSRGGLKGMAVGSMVCTIVGMMIAVVGAMVTPFAFLFGMLVVLAGTILWLLFLRGVAHELNAVGAERSATLLLISTVVNVVLYILMFLLILAVGYVVLQALPGVGSVGGASRTTASTVSGLGYAVIGLSISNMILGLVNYIWYFVLLHSVREAVRRSLRR